MTLVLEGNGALKLPVGSSAQRPSSPLWGMTRFNSDVSTLETYNGSPWLSVQNQGAGVVNNLSTVTTNYTVSVNDYYILINAASNNITLTLPSAIKSGTTYTFKRIDSSSNTVTLTPPSLGLDSPPVYIDGETSISIIRQYNSFTITTDSNNWFIV
jgi:hypothetical protein